MKFAFFLLTFLGGWHLGLGQAVLPTLLSPAGGSLQNGGFEINWSLGQTGTQTLLGPNFQLTEGFHQPYFILTALYNPNIFDEAVIFPNPSNGLLHVFSKSGRAKLSSWHIANSQGRIMLSGPMNPEQHSLDIDVSALKNGVYFLVLEDKTSGIKKSISFLKIAQP